MMGSTPDEVDGAALERAIAGDLSATHELFRSHYPRLLNYVRKRLPKELGTVVDAEDVVHDTLYDAAGAISGFRPEGHDAFFRWLVTIARNRVAMLARRHVLRRLAPTNGVGDGDEGVTSLLDRLAAHRRSPSGSAAAHEFMCSLERALEQLPSQYREVVTLRHLDGLTVAETAQRMGKTNEAIYLLSCRALQAIRTELRSGSKFV